MTALSLPHKTQDWIHSWCRDRLGEVFLFCVYLWVFVCRGEERKTEREKGGRSASQQVEISFSPLCLNSWSQSGLDLFFSGFSPATCPALTLLTGTAPPGWHNTKFPPQFGFQVCVTKHFSSASELHSLMCINQLYGTNTIKHVFGFLKHIFSIIGVTGERQKGSISTELAVQLSMESTRQTTHVN